MNQRKSKEEILANVVGPNRHTRAELEAMDQYAEQEAIEFWKFCEKNGYHLTLAAKGIFQLFKNQSK